MGIAALAIAGPLAAAVLALLIRRFAAGLALLGAATGLVASIVTLGRVADGARFTVTLPGLPEWPLRLVADPLGATFSAVVAVVGAFVLVYAVGYMAGEDDAIRFFAGMAFFVAAMQLLVLAGDWVLFLAAWEVIGLASYLLIGFWFARPGVGAAATRAFLVTRAADLGLYLGVMIVIVDTGTSAMTGTGNAGGRTGALAGLAFLLAAAGKSAQAPLQGWLQDAMAGPTPVSALLHAATLVVAGVVLLVRAFPLVPDGVLLTIGLVGGISSILTGLTAVAQRDLKRLLAASTSSQLGLMLLALGAGSVPVAVFHLITHAAMKSTLFLAAGVFQHDRRATTFDDLRGIGRQRKATFAAFTVAGLALAGIPPLAGFWSKDAILAATLHARFAIVLAPLATIAMALTGVYIGRACRLLWQGDGAPHDAAGAASGMRWMGTGLGILALLAAEPFGRLLEAELAEDVAAALIGLLAALAGLAVGWLAPVTRLFGPAYDKVLAGFRIQGGWATFAGEPALMLARRLDRLDASIHAIVRGGGCHALALATWGRSADDRVHDGVRSVGRWSLAGARASQWLDREGIEAFITGLVRETRRLGFHVRRLQSGLVHRELLLASGGVAALLVLVMIV